MHDKICRLCFELTDNTIGIFSLNGVNLKIATVIQKHFGVDEVRADDILPNCVCIECWEKLADFHDFYNAVHEAKAIFLQTAAMKNEFPNPINVNCDPVGCEDNDSPMTNEPMDFQFVDVKPTPLIRSHVLNETQKRNQSVAAKVIISYGKIDDKSMSANGNNAQLISDSLNMTCFYCALQIKTLSDLTEHHQHEHSEESQLRVKCCDTKLELTDLLDHMEYHRNSDKYRCTKCDTNFVLDKDLRKHAKNFHPRKSRVYTYKCDVCMRNFYHMINLKRHIIAAHTNNRDVAVSQFQCTICKKSLSTKARLAEHVKAVHHRVCHRCGEEFNSNSDLCQHLQTHNDVVEPKVYCDAPRCPVCSIEFTAHTNIIRHLKKHGTTAPRLTCKICDRTYGNAKSLRRHSIIHEDEGKNFPCSNCAVIFPNRRALAEHIRRAHKLP